jgi:Phosphotransferase enzyme family
VIAFVRLQPDRAPRVPEHDILRAITEFGPRSFAIPAPLGGGVAREWEWLAIAPIDRLHRPDWKVAPGPLSDEISAALTGALGPAPTSGWAPMHGDLAPWNLRKQRTRPIVIDWETAAFGPPRADATYLMATRAATRGRDPEVPIGRETARFWVRQLEARAVGSGADAALRARLLELFRAGASP